MEILKILVSAVLIGIISEVAKRSTWAGAVIASIPLTSVLAMIWLYHETGDLSRVARFSVGVFWLVIPSLVLFLLLPTLLFRLQMTFYPALGLSVLATAGAYFLMAFVLRKYGAPI